MLELPKQVMDEAKALHEKMSAYRQHLHQNPEIHLDLPDTSKYVKEKLQALGYEPVDCGECGVLAIAGGKKPGKVFLIRADMDALPVVEEADLPFKSTNQNMHACGHDMHTAMLLGAAEILKKYEDEIEGTIKLMFQPGEETLSGAKSMIAAGVLENPAVDCAMMIHVMAGLPIPTGKVIVPAGDSRMAASDWFEIVIKGKGGHGAMPNTTVDPINVAVHTHIALQAINSRELSPVDSAALTVGLLKSGTTSNVIPDTAQMKGTIRTFTAETREMIKKRVVEISEGVAKTFRAEADVKIIDGCPALVNSPALSQRVEAYLLEMLGAENVINGAKIGQSKVTGSEDFSFVSEKVPVMMLALPAGNTQEGYIYPQHHPKVCFDEKALPVGAAAYAYVPLKWLKENK